MDFLHTAEMSAREVVPEIVARHRSAGILTWKILFAIEAEVIAELAATGEHDPWILNMMRAADVMGYPTDSTPASFKNAGVVPLIFHAIEQAWDRVH